MTIGIIDYGMGNLRSVQKALEAVGAQAAILTWPGQQTSDIGKLILPGVGAFADGMEHLRQRGWVEPILAWCDAGKPMLGICLGLQLLFDSSQEDAASHDEPVSGLGVLSGQVVRLDVDQRDKPMKVPHMGWNSLTWQRDDPLLAGLTQGDHVYFVHGYHAVPTAFGSTDDTLTSAVTDYGGPVCASVWRDNVWATQFHPEKSQHVGLRILANFAGK